MVNKRMLTKDLKNGMTLVSMYNDQKLLINHYPNGVSLFSFPFSPYYNYLVIAIILFFISFSS